MKEKNQRKAAQGAVPPIKWVDPKLDTAFKIILGNTRFLLPMIQDLFGELGLPNVRELAFDLDRVQQASTLAGKSGSLDLVATLKNTARVMVEMQREDQGNISNRLHFYLARVFGHQFKRGMNHNDPKVLPTLVIGILDFKIENTNPDTMIHHFTLADHSNGCRLVPTPARLDNLGIVTIELPKLDAYLARQSHITNFACWAAFWRDLVRDRVMAKSYKVTREARELLEDSKHDEGIAAALRRDMEIINDPVSMRKSLKSELLRKGREEGREEGRREERKCAEEALKKFVLNMHANGFAVAVIAENLSISLSKARKLISEAKPSNKKAKK
jgi:predicted transposase/invertase (TIGR01784 family)